MAREIRADMYEGNPARRQGSVRAQRRGFAYGSYGRGGGLSGSSVAWKEPEEAVYRGRRDGGRRTGSQAAVRRKPQNAGGRSGRKKKAARRILTGIRFYFMLAGIIATCWMIWSLFSRDDEKVHAESGMERTAQEESALAQAYGENGGGFSLEVTPQIRQECQDLYARQGELLLLVNKDHELAASCQPVLHSICKGRLEAADILYDDLCDMLKAGGEAGYEYWIASAHRDRSYQQGLVDEDVQKYMAKGCSYEEALEKTYEYTMPVGASEHETGLALDILCSTNTIMDASQAYEPGNRWLVQHCHEYGFILRYPEDKADITGISYEPWHFRYVGKEAAAYLKEKGWTLEEFHEVVNGVI